MVSFFSNFGRKAEGFGSKVKKTCAAGRKEFLGCNLQIANRFRLVVLRNVQEVTEVLRFCTFDGNLRLLSSASGLSCRSVLLIPGHTLRSKYGHFESVLLFVIGYFLANFKCWKTKQLKVAN